MSSEADANLDEFLSLLEGDAEEPSEPTSALGSPVRKELKDLTYEDVFGSPSPEKKKRKIEDNRSRIVGESSSFLTDLQSGSTEPSFRSSSSRNLFYEVAAPMKPSLVNKTPNLAAGLDTNQLIIDHFSRIRVYKTSITLYYDDTMKPETVLKERNMGLQYVSLLSFNLWYRMKKGTPEEKSFWTSAVLTRKLPGVRKSSKGNEYVVWELNDLKELEKCWTLFLFGSAATSSNLTATPIGSLIDLTTPSVMDNSNGSFKFSVNNSNQVRLIATAKDYGVCQSKRKDGKDCTAVVNTWECCVCIHHAGSELRKMNNKKSKSTSKSSVSFDKNTKFASFSGPKSTSELKNEGVVTLNFGNSKNKNKDTTSTSTAVPAHIKKSGTRMALQGNSVCGGELKRNTASIGNSSSISFQKEKHQFLIQEPAKPAAARKPVNLDPSKTRHLTDSDRTILAALGGEQKSNELKTEGKKGNPKSTLFNPELVSRMASNPTAGGMNFLRYMNSNKGKTEDNKDPLDTSKPEIQPISMTRKTIMSMKKALDLVKTKGPIKKVDPNAVPRRKSIPVNFKEGESSSQGSSSSSRKRGIEVEFDFESDEFKKILNAKSAHEDHLADVQQEEYFDKLGKKEAIENKLLNTFSIATNAVMCRQCKYVALGQSDFCKELGHQIRIVKANKRFFKCKDCGNRTMSLDRLPKHPCKNCSSSNWLSAPVGKEKRGPVLANEVLSIRGNEEKFIGSAGSKMFLNLEVA